MIFQFKYLPGSPKMFIRKKHKDLDKLSKFISDHSIKLFIHGPYVLNIARPTSYIKAMEHSNVLLTN